MAFLSAHVDKLDEDSRRRLETNPLRVLDSKSPEVQALVANAPALLDHLGDDSKRRFERVRASLTALGVANEIDPRLVRGLDYYTGTIFEIKVKSGDLGAQNTVVGGGRYDRLVESLGGPRTPALGFGMGIERVLLALPETAESFEPPLNVFFAPLDAAALDYALPLAHRLRAAGVRVEIEHRTASLKSQLKRADKLRARLAVIIGENEVKSGRLTVKDLAKGTQQEVAGRRARGQGAAGAGLRGRMRQAASRHGGRFWSHWRAACSELVGRRAARRRRRRRDAVDAAAAADRRPTPARRFRAHCSTASTSPAGTATSASRRPARRRWGSTTTRRASIRWSPSTASRRSGSAARSGAR